MARSDPFLQFQADLLGIPLHRSPQTESTALGAALLAGVGVGLWSDPGTAAAQLQAGSRTFLPERDDAWRLASQERWQRAVETVRRHYGQP
jgi:glycerol kinase